MGMALGTELGKALGKALGQWWEQAERRHPLAAWWLCMCDTGRT